MIAPRVFLSHASADAAFANHLAEDLRRLGADVWLDSSHMGSGDFVSHINTALAGRDALILVMTPAAIHSQWVTREVNAAIARENQGLMRPMVVVMAQPCDLRDIPPLWTTYHRYDASRDFTGAVLGVAKELGLTIPKPPPSDSPSPNPRDTPKPESAPAKPQAATMEMPFTFSRLAFAALAVLATSILCTNLLAAGRISALWLVQSSQFASASLLSIPILFASQAVGLWALWGSVRTAWWRLQRRPSHPWLVGGFAVVEVLLIPALLLLHQLDVLEGVGTPPGWLYQTTGGTFIGSAGLFLIVLIATCAMAGSVRQWSWILWLLAPFVALAFILYVLNYDYGAENLRIAAVALLYGLPATWLFIAFSFALFCPAANAK